MTPVPRVRGAGRQPYAEQCTRVYTRAGKVAHLMSPIETIRNGNSLCPVLPDWPDEWRGTGSQREIELAASLPTCKRCEESAAGEDAYYAEARQFRDPPKVAS